MYVCITFKVLQYCLVKFYFIENYNKSLEILNKNIKKLKCEKKTKVFDDDVFNFFKNDRLKNEKLDLIFLDPPYKEENIKTILENIANSKILKETGLIVLHRHKKTKDDIGNKFIIKSKKWIHSSISISI